MVGLVIGKFYPPHKGHGFLINFARERVDRLIILLCVHKDQTIPGEVRQAWLQEIHPNCEVVQVPDELPESPEPWAKFTQEVLGFAPDIVFSSEDYGMPYATAMGAQHVLVDRERCNVPICATAIRANPLDNLEYLEPCVRAYFVQRVVLVGAESTGKTTLAQRLATELSTDWVPEYGREFAEQKLQAEFGVTDIARIPQGKQMSWTTDDFVSIAETQNRKEEEIARSAKRLLICDTDALATAIWHERYMGFKSPAVARLALPLRNRFYVVTQPDFPFVQDGTRDGEGIRDWMHIRFVETMRALRANHLVVGGSIEVRVEQVLDAIKDFALS